jgi:hypothetical protein
MRFRKKTQNNPKPELVAVERRNTSPEIHAHKYSVRFDILPEISYLDEHLCILIADFLPLLRGFPDDVWLSQKRVEEGLDFCYINFWAFTEAPDAIKEFAIWFQGIFREEAVSELLERFVQRALEKPDDAEVIIANWSRGHATEAEVREVVEREMTK